MGRCDGRDAEFLTAEALVRLRAANPTSPAASLQGCDPPPPLAQPNQQRHQERQLEAEAAGPHGPDVVAALEGRAVERLARDACLRVAERDTRLLNTVMGDEVGEAVVVHIFEMTEPTVVRRGSSGAEGQCRHIHVRHVEGVRAEDRDGDHARARGVDRVRIAEGLDVDVRLVRDPKLLHPMIARVDHEDEPVIVRPHGVGEVELTLSGAERSPFRQDSLANHP